MKNVIDYDIVTAKGETAEKAIANLAEKMKRKIYKPTCPIPQGGVTVVYDANINEFVASQAIIEC